MLVTIGRTAAQQQGVPAPGSTFDVLADQLDRDELVIETQREALQLLDRLKALVPAGDVRRELRYRYLYCIIGLDSDPVGGVAYAEHGLADARRAGYTEAEINFHFCRGSNQESLTTPRDALADYNAAIELARRDENTRLVADGLTWRGSVQSLLGEHALALVDFLEAQNFYDSSGVPIESDQNLFNIAVAYRRLGQQAEARQYLRRLMQQGVERNDIGQQMAAHMQLGFLDAEAAGDQLPAARAHFDRALAMAQKIDSQAAQGSAHLALAQVLNQAGDFRAALAQLDAARTNLQATGDHSDGDMLALQAGEAHAGLGDHVQALEDYARAEAFLQKSGNLRYLADLLEHRSLSYEALGKPEQALADMRHMVKVHAVLDRKARSNSTTLLSYQFDTARRERENRKLEADRALREEQVAALQRVRRWQRLALAMGAVLILLLTWLALRQLRRSRRLHRMAMTDPLTGVANRRRLAQLGQLALEHARGMGEPLSLIALDVDHFKRVNDSYGHPVGDQVLIRLAAVCQHALRQVDHLGRMGGEEFVVILPGSDAAAACLVAERLRREVRALALNDLAPGLTVSISLGVAEAEPTDADLEQLIARADEALYRAKDHGRNRVDVAAA
ncbi:diguanylate cyclase [Dyella sp.]|uniref:diguanylate cyclase n=1 Tax=Dyella sp. TaxID=1869338 RepID=UPI002D79817F|nr:diguanylate cyclase [Dyella sp.]HET6433054.1 diguanylate cyclase [Dyella sp.]